MNDEETKELGGSRAVVFRLGGDGTILDLNVDACRLFRLSRKKCLGNKLQQLTFSSQIELGRQLQLEIQNHFEGTNTSPRLENDMGKSYTLSFSTQAGELEVILSPVLPPTPSQTNSSLGKLGLGIREIGKYQLIRQIGRGGMGQVFSARDAFDNRVAIKLLLAGEHADEKDLLRFKREGVIMARLNHRNICRIIEMGEHMGERYIAMEYLDGYTLDSLIDEHGLDLNKLQLHPSLNESLAAIRDTHAERLNIKRILRVFLDILEGIHYAHQFDIVHRDLKPANIMIRKTGEPVVMDFGLAKYQDIGEYIQVSQSGEVMGTLEYIAPEQAATSTEVDLRADIYSACAILYLLLTGHKKMKSSGNLYEDLSRLNEEQAEPPSKHRASIPKDLDVVVLKGLSIEPQRRYASIRELATDIQAIISDMPILARKENFGAQLWRTIRRHQRISTTIALLLLIFVSLLTYHYFAMRSSLDLFLAAERRTQFERERAGAAIAELHQQLDATLQNKRWGPSEVLALKILHLDTKDSLAQQALEFVEIESLLEAHPVPTHPLSGHPLRIKTLEEDLAAWKPLQHLARAQNIYRQLEELLQQEKLKHRELFHHFPSIELQEDTWGPYFINAQGIVMRYIPPGNFTMGDVSLDADHEVLLDHPFFLSQTEVTQEQWLKVMDINPSQYVGKQRPVENLAWNAALAFALALNGTPKSLEEDLIPSRENYQQIINTPGYRLPTEAEWEYACRSDFASRNFFWQSLNSPRVSPPPLWYADNTGTDHQHRSTRAVGGFSPNLWGLQDMHGNVFEWVLDTYSPYFYQESPRLNPVNVQLSGPGIIRGGSFRNSLFSCRAGFRQAFDIDDHNEGIGFRIVWIPPLIP